MPTFEPRPGNRAGLFSLSRAGGRDPPAGWVSLWICSGRHGIVGPNSRTSTPGVGPASMFKIYIGNLDKSVTLDDLKKLLSAFEDVEDLVLATDPETGKSRCFAIAMFREAMRGQLLIETISGKMFSGRPIVANEAVKKGKKPLAPKDESAVRSPGPGGPRGLGGANGGNRPFGQRPTLGGRPSSRPSNRPFNRPSRPEFGSAGGARGGPSGGSGPGSFSRPGSRPERAPDPPPPSPPRPYLASGRPSAPPPSAPGAGPGPGTGTGPTTPPGGRPSSRPGFPAVRRADSPTPPPIPRKKPEE